MKFKQKIMYFIIYNLIVLAVYLTLKHTGLSEKIIRYIMFNTEVFKFQDLLSVTITILTVLLGAIITVATVLISMCDKRLIKLINTYNKSDFLISTIKTSILTGLLSVILLAIVYARIDMNKLTIRLGIMYITGMLFFIFIHKSKLLISLILKLLKDSFKGTDNIIEDVGFKRPKK